MKSGTVNVLRWFSAHSYNCCCHVYTAAHHVLLSDMYSACSRITATVVGCVQQENSYCCQMGTAGKQLLLSDVQSRKTATVVRCVQLHIHPKSLCIFPTACSPVSLCPYICPSFCLRVCMFLTICLSVSLSVPFLPYRSNERY